MPQDPFSAALSLHQAGQFDAALAAYERLLFDVPRHAEALHLSGLILFQKERPTEARDRIEQSLAVDAAQADPWANIALVYDALGDHDKAVVALREAIQRAPDAVEIWLNLAAAEYRNGFHGDAERAARRAITLAPEHGGAWFNLALALQGQGRIKDALVAAATAVKRLPADVSPLGLLAELELANGDPSAAVATLGKGLRLNAEEPTLLLLRARAYERMGRANDALSSFSAAHRAQPKEGAILSEFLFLAKRVCDWRITLVLSKTFRAGLHANTMPRLSPFCLLSEPSSRSDQRVCAERWCNEFSERSNALPFERPLRKVRLGYLSSDFHEHATTVLAAGLFETHDRDRFELFGYSSGIDDGSAMRRRVEASFDHFVEARYWPDQQLAQKIRDDGIDVLVDLKGHTEGAPTGVLALRPAPIQVSYLGYPGTTGAPWIDYLIGDATVTPFEHAPDYSETLVQLTHSYQVNDTSRVMGTVPSRMALGLPATGTVYCGFGNPYKINAQVLDAWVAIVKAVPGSVLWLQAKSVSDPVIAHLQREVQLRNLDAARVVFAYSRPNAEYLAMLGIGDVFLDTWPYNAHTTASDALWAGCPVITWLGETFASRVAASLLNAVGLPVLVANDVHAYTDLAVALGKDEKRRVGLRDYLLSKGRESRLFDVQQTARGLEAAYLEMVEQRIRRDTRAFRVGAAITES